MIYMNHILKNHSESMHSLESSKVINSKSSLLSHDHS